MYDAITWIFGVGVFLALLVAYGLGANDVANTFGPSVGAKALTMRQAVLVAAIFEFSGAVLMGAGVTDTIRSGITNLSYFNERPDILAYGMMCALAGAGTWMLIATYLELPVSSTQSIVSSIAGMAIVAEGWNAVVWSEKMSAFPYLKGMAAIALSWLFSPFLAFSSAFLLFGLVRLVVLRHENAYKRSLVLLPAFVFVSAFVVTWFIIARGGLQFGWEKTPDPKKAWISVIVATGLTLISAFLGIPLIKRNVQRDLDAQEETRRANEASALEVGKVMGSKDADTDIVVADVNSDEGSSGVAARAEGEGAAAPSTYQAMRSVLQKNVIWRALNYGMNYDIHKVIETDAKIADIHANSESFDSKAELSFKYLQVCTACANSFAHGSNEVANAIGPLAAIYAVWQYGMVSAKAPVPTWLLAVGGFGIAVGLATFGYKVIRSMGVKVTRLTNSRGFCVEICVAAVIIVASRFGIPMSSTPATVGAIAGVGAWEGWAGVNGRLLLKMASGWVVTVIAAVSLTCVFMAQGLYAPSKNGGRLP